MTKLEEQWKELLEVLQLQESSLILANTIEMFRSQCDEILFWIKDMVRIL